MRRLTRNQAVRVDLDAKVDWEVHSLDCRVMSVQGPVATLAPRGPVGEDVQARLKSGVMCFLTFEHGRAPVALRGAVLAKADTAELEFVVVDGIQVAERRSAERTQIVVGVRAVPLDTGEPDPLPVSTVTSNLSMGGALLLRRPGLGEGSRWRIELLLPGQAEPVCCIAELARATPTHLGVRFREMEEPDQLRVAGVLAGAQRRAPALV